VQWPKPLPDFYGEDRHELVQKLAYRRWEKRGSQLGSREIDWFATEKVLIHLKKSSGSDNALHENRDDDEYKKFAQDNVENLAPFMIHELFSLPTETASGSHPCCVVSVTYDQTVLSRR
jgi:hypothetical protein